MQSHMRVNIDRLELGTRRRSVPTEFRSFCAGGRLDSFNVSEIIQTQRMGIEAKNILYLAKREKT
jgi:hypothetical protein